MSEIFREVDEALQQETLKRNAKRYGPWIAAVVITAIASTAGAVWWRDSQQLAREQNTEAIVAAFETSVAAARADTAGPAQGALALLEAVTGQTDARYQWLARFALASAQASDGAAAEAADLYRELFADGGPSPAWRELARYLAVLNGLDDPNTPPEQLSAELAPLLDASSVWRYPAQELDGMIAIKAGDWDRARSVLAALHGTPEAPQAIRSRASTLLDSLAP